MNHIGETGFYLCPNCGQPSPPIPHVEGKGSERRYGWACAKCKTVATANKWKWQREEEGEGEK